ncbi:MAG: glycosyltransferase family 1 protein [Tannerellaceae bacterium]
MKKQHLSVLYDSQTFEIQRYGGISRYFYEIIKRMSNCDKEVSLLFSHNQYIKKKDICLYYSFVPFSVFKLFKGAFRFLNRRKTIKALLAKRCLFHPTYYDAYYLSVLGDSPLVLTVHDMIHEKFPCYFSLKDKTAKNKALLISKADRIIAVSHWTKRDLVELLHVNPDKIDVIHHGINPLKSTYAGLSLPKSYLLYVGERQKYKNYSRLLHVFVRLQAEQPELRLICTGKPFKKEELEELKELGLSDCVSYVNATDNELGQLYRDARLFVYPSLYEGFGIPILEAYSQECPVVLSNTSCFPEVAGDAGEYFNPESEDEMAAAIRRVLTDDERRLELIRLGNIRVKQFSWDETARKTEDTYQKIFDLQ